MSDLGDPSEFKKRHLVARFGALKFSVSIFSHSGLFLDIFERCQKSQIRSQIQVYSGRIRYMVTSGICQLENKKNDGRGNALFAVLDNNVVTVPRHRVIQKNQ